MEIRINNENCEICGRAFSDFPHSAFRKQYKCPKCERIVCCACFFEHKCGRRLCSWCLANTLECEKQSKREVAYTKHGILRDTDYMHTFTIFKHGWRGPACSMCKKKDDWYCMYDLISVSQ